MWQEVERFHVRNEHGHTHMLVRMTKTADFEPLVGKRRAVPEANFYFLLNGSNVTIASDGSFMVEDTGEILMRA